MFLGQSPRSDLPLLFVLYFGRRLGGPRQASLNELYQFPPDGALQLSSSSFAVVVVVVIVIVVINIEPGREGFCGDFVGRAT